MSSSTFSLIFFFFIDTATSDIYTLSLHDALPILCGELRLLLGFDVARETRGGQGGLRGQARGTQDPRQPQTPRSEEHTSELQSRENLVCRLLLEKKKIQLTFSIATVWIIYFMSLI